MTELRSQLEVLRVLMDQLTQAIEREDHEESQRAILGLLESLTRAYGKIAVIRSRDNQ